MIQIEESNPSFESCDKCIYSGDSEETCILRRCIHAVSQLKECYVPKQPTIEPDLQPDGTLVVDCANYDNVRRVLVQHGTNGTLFYVDAERKKGRWKRVSADRYTQSAIYVYRCDKCEKCNFGMSDFCPNCGAQMTEDNK